VLNLPSGDIGSVVFSTTHDLEKINEQNPALMMGEYSKILLNEKENYKIILITCYLLQRIYNIPLIFKTQIDIPQIKDSIKFRKYLYDKKCTREESSVIDRIIFKSIKYNDTKKIGTFYLNVSNENKKIDGIEINARDIHISLE
jgi:hypothetical protein